MIWWREAVFREVASYWTVKDSGSRLRETEVVLAVAAKNGEHGDVTLRIGDSDVAVLRRSAVEVVQQAGS